MQLPEVEEKYFGKNGMPITFTYVLDKDTKIGSKATITISLPEYFTLYNNLPGCKLDNGNGRGFLPVKCSMMKKTNGTKIVIQFDSIQRTVKKGKNQIEITSFLIIAKDQPKLKVSSDHNRRIYEYQIEYSVVINDKVRRYFTYHDGFIYPKSLSHSMEYREGGLGIWNYANYSNDKLQMNILQYPFQQNSQIWINFETPMLDRLKNPLKYVFYLDWNSQNGPDEEQENFILDYPCNSVVIYP
jgi:hypothetical protein